MDNINHKELLDKIEKKASTLQTKVKLPFNVKSLILILIAISLGVIISLTIVFLLVYFL